jgi:hypothetical protein
MMHNIAITILFGRRERDRYSLTTSMSRWLACSVSLVMRSGSVVAKADMFTIASESLFAKGAKCKRKVV